MRDEKKSHNTHAEQGLSVAVPCRNLNNTMKIFIITLVFVLSSAVLAQPTPPAEAERAPKSALQVEVDSLIQEAIFFEEQGDIDGAIESYENASTLCPTCPEVYANWAVFFAGEEELDSAITYASAAIQVGPHFLEAYMIRGSYYDQQKKYEKAIADFKKIVEIDTTHKEFYFDIAAVYDEWGKKKEALEYYDKFLAAKTNDELDLIQHAEDRADSLDNELNGKK